MLKSTGTSTRRNIAATSLDRSSRSPVCIDLTSSVSGLERKPHARETRDLLA
jgi:hypothetical protein